MFNPLRCWWSSTVLAALILSGCAIAPTPKMSECSCPAGEKQAKIEKKDEKPALPLFIKSDFSSLPGWSTANHARFLEAFAEQCSVNGNALAKRKATPTGLLEACRKARQNLSGNALLPAQIWMEANFDVWQFQQEDGKKEGLLTGYFEPLLKGSRKAQGAFNAPLYGVPADLITVKLDDIYPELKGKRLRGRLQGNTLVPFFDRAEWERLGPDREQPIVWVDDKLDAFLLQVQGSGRVTLPDGSVKENKVLRPQEGPVGAMGVPLTGKLSLAIDREKVPYGSPIWIESSNPVTNTPIAQGTLAQDTGGAIRGRVRADYFWGTGEEAGTAAGLTRQPLKMWLIWPKGTPLPESGS